MNRRSFLKLLGGGLAVGAAATVMPIDFLRHEQEQRAETYAASYIPELWASELQRALRKQWVYADVVNRGYEGQIHGLSIKASDRIRVPRIAEVA